jgi:hypothetical protein
MRSLLSLSVRKMGTARDIDDLLPRLEAAFGCRFTRGEFNTVPAFVGETLGMLIGVFPWVGRGGARVIRVDSYPADDRYLKDPDGQHADVKWIDITDVVIDLLEINGTGQWFAPNADDLAADIELGAAIDRHDFGDEGGE